METYEKIKQLRLNLGMSQTELAKKAGYTDRSSIAKIEAGNVDLTETKIKALSFALNVSPAELMCLSDEKPVSFSVQEPTLTEQEQELLDIFRAMNKYGKDKALDYLRDLSDMPKYQIGDSAVSVG